MENNVVRLTNLRSFVDVSNLCDAFKRYGRIFAADVELDKAGKSLNKGYIRFDNYASALSSVKFMNGDTYLGNPLCVEMNISDDHFAKIYLKNLPLKWDDCDLIREFKKFGEIKKTVLLENHETQHKFGFIEFKEHKSAKIAVKCMNGSIIEGEEVIVERYKEKIEREFEKQHSLECAQVKLKKSRQLNNLHVKNLPKNMTHRDLERLFQPFGDIISCKVMEDEFSRSKGFGFVSFENAADAKKALQRMNNFSFNSNILKVNFKENKEDRAHFLNLKKIDENFERKNEYYKERKYASASSLQFVPQSLVKLRHNKT